MPIWIIAGGVLLLFVLITVFRLHAFITFVVVSLLVGLAGGLPVLQAVTAIQKGIGDTLGSLIMILGFGAMLGKLVADSGAAQVITQWMVKAFGLKRIHWALMVTGLIVGIPMFYTVGFVILVPLVFTVAASTKLPLLYVALPMLASLSVTHGFLPPHPAPTAIAETFKADMGLTLLLGLVLSIPASVVVIPLFSKRSKLFNPQPLKEFTTVVWKPKEELPAPGISFFISLLPVILIGLSTVVRIASPEKSWLNQAASIIGDPVLAMLLALLTAIYFLGVRRAVSMKNIGESLSQSFAGIANVLLIIGGAGGLKEVLTQSGASQYIGEWMADAPLSPLFMAWLIAAVIRVSVGSATVAGMTAAGIVLPLLSQPDVSPELMVLAIGAGSIFFSHVNDGGFWLFKEYFNLSVKDTLATWSLMETTVSVVGLIGVLMLSWVV